MPVANGRPARRGTPRRPSRAPARTTSWPSAGERLGGARGGGRAARRRRERRAARSSASRIGTLGRASARGRAANGGGRRREVQWSPGSWPAIASSATAVSSTVRVSTPSATMPWPTSPKSGPIETRPRLGLSPTSPQQEAGMRIEPPRSLPSASATMPAATAAALPPEEPPAAEPPVPGVAGRAEARVLGDRPQPELGRVRLADDDRAGLAQAPDVRAVVVGDQSPNAR